MNIAITGSNGFLGRHLTKHLEKLGYSVRLLQRKNGKNVFKIKNFANYPDWDLALSGIDVLIHCAAIVHQKKDFNKNKYKEFEDININLTKVLGIEAVKAKVKRIIFISSIKVNGEKTIIGKPLNNYSLVSPSDNYSISKFLAEENLKLLSNQENIEVVIIRPPLIYGPNVKANFLNLIKIINLGVPLPFLKVNNYRSLIYVENLVDFIAECINKKNAANKVFLISDPSPISTSKLINLISSSLNKKSRLFSLPIFLIKLLSNLTKTKDKIDKIVDNLEIDPTLSFESLSWSPPYSTEEGIKKTIDWFKKNQSSKIL